MRLLPVAVFLLALLPAFVLLFMAPFNPDELEYFRASRWVASGLVPFRDFWEHHLPLHWFLLAPFAPLTRSATIESLLVLRLAQLPVIAATIVVVVRTLTRAGVSRAASLIGVSFFFLAVHRSVIEIRIDVTMNLLVVAALLALTWDRGAGGERPGRPFLAGVLLGLACLASQRAIPTALIAAAAASVPELVTGSRFRLPTLVRAPVVVVAGLFSTAIVFAAAAWASGALPALWEQCFRLNVLYEQLSPHDDLGPSALDWASRFLRRPGAVALVAFGAAGAFLGIRDPRTRGTASIAAILTATQVALLFAIRSPFPYQFQTLFWLGALLAAFALDSLMGSGRRSAVGVAVAGAILAVCGTLLAFQSIRWRVLADTLAHQDHVLRTVDRLSPAGSVVLEGCGFAVNRRPAMRTWFLPSLARDLIAAGVIEIPTVAELASRRIALVVADSRLLATLQDEKTLGPFVARNFFPLERFVWAPAPNARLLPGERLEWTVLTDGPHRVVDLPYLVSHPWFESPWSFPFQRPKTESAYRVDVARRLPPDPARIRLHLDGAPLDTARGGVVALRAGSILTAENRSATIQAVLVLPARFRVVFDAPFPSTYIEPSLEF